MIRTTTFAVLLCTVLAAGAEPRRRFVIGAEDWARPRSAEHLLGFSALRDLAAVYDALPGPAHIEIRHPGGEEGTLWAEELRDWLVSLGYGSDELRLVPGLAAPDRIELVIVEDAP